MDTLNYIIHITMIALIIIYRHRIKALKEKLTLYETLDVHKLNEFYLLKIEKNKLENERK
jgi:hypothetical protein